MNIEQVMYEAAVKQFESANELEVGSEEYARAIKGANDTVDRLHEQTKIKIEKEQVRIDNEKVNNDKQKIEYDRKWKKIETVINVASLVSIIGVNIWANVSAKDFERDYNHTTEAGRQSQRYLLGLLPKPKFKIL